MDKKHRHVLFTLIGIGLGITGITALSLFFFLKGGDMGVMYPKGLIAHKERFLIIVSSLLMLIVVIPVFFLTFLTAWKYREGNHKVKYSPDWDKSHLIEAIWWAIPLVIVIVLSVLAWKDSHALDPYKPLVGDKKPITIQVVALEWKWLFIYPEQNIAAVNLVRFPEHTPLNFEITSDAPMNSFWIPQLGGQIYAMAGMKSRLHLMATEKGKFDGVSANISGTGFAGMRFVAVSSSQEEFDAWVDSVKSSQVLDAGAYEKLMMPSENNPAATYVLGDKSLFNQILMKYMK